VAVSSSWGKVKQLPGGNGRFLPKRSNEPWVLASGLHPAPPSALGKASRHTQAHAGPAPRPKENSLGANCHGNPAVPSTSPPSRSPLLLALQPTGLCASLERAIKPVLVSLAA
jgi:hypothetical protein